MLTSGTSLTINVYNERWPGGMTVQQVQQQLGIIIVNVSVSVASSGVSGGPVRVAAMIHRGRHDTSHSNIQWCLDRRPDNMTPPC